MQQNYVNTSERPAPDNLPARPGGLPHGLVTPPPEVLALLEAERAKFPPEQFARHAERLLNEWTVGYFFDGLCHEVIYRPTPAGPEVLAVGSDEVFALRAKTPIEEQTRLKTFLGY
jgi:hypothetical protein